VLKKKGNVKFGKDSNKKISPKKEIKLTHKQIIAEYKISCKYRTSYGDCFGK